MYMDINKYLLIFIGCFVRSSYQLYCVQCTSSIQLSSNSWDHSCLDGNLPPLLCEDRSNASEPISRRCMSAVYKINKRASAGIQITRGCTAVLKIQHDCDPVMSYADIENIDSFYCQQSCYNDGCNKHGIETIISIASSSLKNEILSLNFISFLYLFCFQSNMLF
ncbi:unnamed protein product [Rotaria magnacalcarata]|uniref:Protein sleepless n=2 Tax=Rotaria magnacalcarata TaxID=392030 RepID=A0A816M842_9BILA|nr:unnamed protein product [Rotaria magnacalcarata]